jgi:hypothetical protein
MVDVFSELLEMTEIERVPAKVRKFLHREPPPGKYEKTWEYFSYGYSNGFEEFAKRALEIWPGREHLALPLFFLARHSIELALKDTILEYAKTDPPPPDLGGHGLMQLWNQLLAYMDRYGLAANDEWGVYCGKLLNHIHEVDPDGERFRYPAARDGAPFELTRVELEGLVKAHWHVTMYCDGCANMHADGYHG